MRLLGRRPGAASFSACVSICLVMMEHSRPSPRAHSGAAPGSFSQYTPSLLPSRPIRGRPDVSVFPEVPASYTAPECMRASGRSYMRNICANIFLPGKRVPATRCLPAGASPVLSFFLLGSLLLVLLMFRYSSTDGGVCLWGALSGRYPFVF